MNVCIAAGNLCSLVQSIWATNYTIEAFTMLYSHAFLFSPCQADQLLWCRFVNTTGRPGKNIAMDLHMEHLNRVCKDAIRSLGANKSPKAIQRIGKCISVLKSVADNFDEQTGMNESKGYHTVASVDKDRDVIINELLSHSIFSPLPGCSHSSFKNIDCSVFSKVNYGLMLQWTKEHMCIVVSQTQHKYRYLNICHNTYIEMQVMVVSMIQNL